MTDDSFHGSVSLWDLDERVVSHIKVVCVV